MIIRTLWSAGACQPQAGLLPLLRTKRHIACSFDAGLHPKSATSRSASRGPSLCDIFKNSTMPPTTPSTSEFRLALRQFATGVTVVTAERAPGQVHGMTANSFTSVSLDPLLVLICVSQTAQLLPLLKRRKRLGVDILKNHQQAISEYFAPTEDNAPLENNPDIRCPCTQRAVRHPRDARDTPASIL